jgi:glycosyltransferase involved in cell wall biosynthesis
MKQRLFFIGALDYPNVPKAGDAVKNRFLVDFFRKELVNVKAVDTQKWKKNPLVLASVLLNLLFRRFDNIVISTSNVSAYRLIRLTTSLHLKSRIYYFMIGGYAQVKIKEGIYKAEPFRKLERIVVEADKVSELYHELGIDNTVRLYNFKRVLYTPDISQPHTGRVRFVFLSRLTELKGIFHILKSARDLNDAGYRERFEVDFYGRIDDDVKARFLDQVSTLDNVSYKGFLNLGEVEGYETLAGYDAMLFPTMYATEGFPGVIADAAISALPVVASDWRYAQEIIGNGKCGILFPVADNNALTDIMRKLIENRQILEPLRKNALERSNEYNVDKVLTRDLITLLGMDKPITD